MGTEKNLYCSKRPGIGQFLFNRWRPLQV